MAGYIRQDTTNNIADGNVINASDFDNEYNAIEAAFNATTGHTHDGTSAEGAPITKIGPTQDVVASTTALTPKTDNTVDLGSSTLEYKDLFIDGTANIDSLVADTADINAGTIDGVTIGGASAGTGTFTTVAATTGNITTVNATTVDATNLEVTNIKAKDGTASASIADTTGVMSLVANPTLSAGTANGVLYLNGSKVATSGSALVYDGTILRVNGSTTSGFRLASNSGASNGFNIYNDSTTDIAYLTNFYNGATVFGVNNTEQMRLTSTGLGIGTGSPGARLDVRGSSPELQVGQAGSSNGVSLAWSNGDGTARINTLGAAWPLLFLQNGSEQMRLTSTGLGIGTSSPSYKLHVASTGLSFLISGGGTGTQYQAINTSGGNYYLGASSSTGGGLLGGASAYSLCLVTESARDIHFGTNNTLRATIDSSGNLGIGTSSPQKKLVVSDAGAVGMEWSPTDNPGSMRQLAYNRSTSAYVPLRTEASQHEFYIGGSERMRLDSSGNLGLGVTPSAWGGSYKDIDVNTLGSLAADTSNVALSSNRFFNGSVNIYKTTAASTIYNQTAGAHQWFTAPSGTAGNAISFTQAMTLDASGNLVVGATSNGVAKIYTYTTSGGVDNFRMADESSTIASGIRAVGDAIAFRTQATERARITSGGVLGIGCNPSAIWPTAATSSGDNGATIAKTYISVSSNASILEYLNRNDGDGTITQYYRTGTAVGSVSVTSTATAYNTSSDRRLKENIQPADDAGSVIDAIEVVKHDWKVGGHTRYGMIAQDLHAVTPEAVSAGDDGDEIEKTWGVDYSKLVPMLIKEVQSLRARVAALESN